MIYKPAEKINTLCQLFILSRGRKTLGFSLTELRGNGDMGVCVCVTSDDKNIYIWYIYYTAKLYMHMVHIFILFSNFLAKTTVSWLCMIINSCNKPC